MSGEVSLLSQAFGLLAAFLGNAIQALGFVLQKKGVAWLGRKRPGDQAFHRDRFVWILGFVAINLVPIFQFISLGFISAPVLSSMTGISVVLTVIFSGIFLGDRIRGTDWVWSLVILIGIRMASYSGAASVVLGFSASAVYIFAILPAAASLPFFLIPALREKKRLGAACFASFAGAASGMMIVLMKVLRIECGTAFLAWLASPWLYLYAANGIFSLAILQFAYKSGEMILIAPLQYGTLVLYPVIASVFVFRSMPNPIQLPAFALIILSIVMIVRRHDK